jgi:hypothetical protein
MKLDVHVDKWEGTVDNGSSFTIEDGSIDKYLGLLDGKKHTQILIIPRDKSNSFLIGGGNNNTYVVTYTIGNDEEFYNLVNPGKTGKNEIELVTGGQAGLFSDRYVLDFNSVLKAANYYLEHCERDPHLHWEKQE